MGNIIRIGPYESSPTFGYSAGYRDDRNADDIQRLLDAKNTPFFGKLLIKLNKKFHTTLPLKILDSGCGYGYTLKSINDISADKKIPIHTTGITMQKNHKIASKWVDTLILGSLQNAYSKKKFDLDSFHFIIDMCGPAFFFPIEDYEARSYILSIYNTLLKKGGFLLLYLLQFNPNNQMLNSHGKKYAEDIRAKTISVLEKNGFKVIFNKQEFALLEKV